MIFTDYKFTLKNCFYTQVRKNICAVNARSETTKQPLWIYHCHLYIRRILSL